MTIDLYLNALGTIAKLLPLIKSFTGERSKDYFHELLQPLFEAFENVHEFYNTLFLDFRRKIVRLAVDNTLFTSVAAELPPTALQELERIKTEFLDVRRKDEGIRDSLRQDAQEDFRNISWEEERRFLASIIYYFLGIGGLAPSDSELDSAIQCVVDQGGISYFDTPSSRFYLAIKASQDTESIISKLDESRSELN